MLDSWKWGNRKMASMMATLMDDFYNLREKNEGDSAYGMAVDQAVSFANNCHQMTSLDTLNCVEGMLRDVLDVAYDDSEAQAYEDALIIVLLNKEKLLTEG